MDRRSITVAKAGLGLVLGAVVGCENVPPPVLIQAPPAVAALPIAVVDDLALTVSYEASHEDCDPRVAPLNHAVVADVRAKLLAAGYKVVTQPSSDALTLKLSGTARCWSWAGVWVNVILTMSLETGGRVLGQSSGRVVGPQLPGDPYTTLLNHITKSVGLAEYAASKGPAPAGSASADASAAPALPPAGVQASKASATAQRTAYGLVIGIEKYRDLPAPSGARADAESFASMLKSTLGIPESNVRVALDDRATRSDIERNLGWLKANVPPGGRVYFFFSGHGAPDAAKGTSYLVPYDGDAQSVDETAIPLDKVLASLGETKAKETLAFVDSCFSGSGGRSVIAKGTRPLVKLKAVSEPAAVVLFSASSGTQISGPSAEGNRGAFTKYLVQGIGEAKADANGDGQLTLQELADWVTPRVEREAKAQSREQTPKLAVGQKAGAPKDLAVAWGLK